MSNEFYEDIRDIVADWILTLAKDSECLHESIYDFSNEHDLTEEEDQEITDLAYELFDRAKVTVLLDEMEYGD